MKQECTKRIRLIYSIVLSVAAVVAGICLIAACWGIYQSGGDQTYTVQKIADAFSPIASPVYLALALAVGSLVLDFALPAEKRNCKPEKNRALLLQRQRAKTDLAATAPELRKQIDAEPRRRRLHAIISLSLLAAGSILFLIYALNGANFDRTDINNSVIRALWLLLPCMAIPFGYSVFAAYAARRSMDRELALLKQAQARPPVSIPKATASHGKWALYVRWGIVCVAIAMMVYGFAAGGWTDVLAKAVNICTECVGLG